MHRDKGCEQSFTIIIRSIDVVFPLNEQTKKSKLTEKDFSLMCIMISLDLVASSFEATAVVQDKNKSYFVESVVVLAQR